MLIQQAIDSLPPKCKEVFRLVLSDKLKNREIADLLGISEKTVNIHIAETYGRIAEYVNRQYKQVKRFKLLLLFGYLTIILSFFVVCCLCISCITYDSFSF